MMARHADSTSMVIALIAMGLCLRLIPQAAGFGARCRGLLVLVMANALTSGVGLYLIGEQMLLDGYLPVSLINLTLNDDNIYQQYNTPHYFHSSIRPNPHLIA